MWRLIILFLLVFFIIFFIYKLGKSIYLDNKKNSVVYDNSYQDFKKNRAKFDDVVDVEHSDMDDDVDNYGNKKH